MQPRAKSAKPPTADPIAAAKYLLRSMLESPVLLLHCGKPSADDRKKLDIDTHNGKTNRQRRSHAGPVRTLLRPACLLRAPEPVAQRWPERTAPGLYIIFA